MLTPLSYALMNDYKAISRLMMILIVIYGLYLLKTALGINISNQYHAPNIFKFPLKLISHKIK